MTIELIANENCWIVESAKFNDKEYREKSGNWHRLKVNNPADYEEVTDAAWQSYCTEYDKRHPEPEPQPENPADTNEPKTEEV